MKKTIHLCYKCRLFEVKFCNEKCSKCKAKAARRKHNEKTPKRRSSEKKMRARLRKMVFSVFPNQCMKCGATKRMLHADHIKPVSKHKKLEYDLMNLQVLCINCNLVKSNKNESDYRKPRQIEEMKRFIGTIGYTNKVVKRYLRDNDIEMKKPKKIIVKKEPVKPRVILRKRNHTNVASQNSSSFTSPI